MKELNDSVLKLSVRHWSSGLVELTGRTTQHRGASSSTSQRGSIGPSDYRVYFSQGARK